MWVDAAAELVEAAISADDDNYYVDVRFRLAWRSGCPLVASHPRCLSI
jgi:hypothetical protein